MGILRHGMTGLNVTLEPENLVGRSPNCSIRVCNSLCSSIHASIRWTPSGWTIKDLGSTNGSFFKGKRLDVRHIQLLSREDAVAFGAVDEEWVLTDDAPPIPTVVAENGQRASGMDLIALPSNDEPRVTLYRTSDSTWCLEGSDVEPRQIVDGSTFEVAGKRWRFSLPVLVAQTDLAHPHSVTSVLLFFGVSRDEEYVSLLARCAHTEIDLGARSSNYMLLLLARQRLEDLRSGVEASSQGWVHQDDLARALRTDPEHVNVDVFRIRKRFAEHFRDAAGIIERRARTRLLRLATSSVEIRTI